MAAVADGRTPCLALRPSCVWRRNPRGGWKPGFHAIRPNPAAALLLLFPVSGGTIILLTKRHPTLRTGQAGVRYLGGAVDASD